MVFENGNRYLALSGSTPTLEEVAQRIVSLMLWLTFKGDGSSRAVSNRRWTWAPVP